MDRVNVNYQYPYVTCSVCGQKYRGKLPKGELDLFPREHRTRTCYGKIKLRSVSKLTCLGSYQTAVDYEEHNMEG